MEIRNAISTVDNLVPNAYSDKDKMKWLKDIETLIYKEIILTHEDSIAMTDFSNDSNELFAKSPYDNLYISYLESKIHYNNKEIPRYNNAMAIFNTEYSEYANWYNRTHMPL